MLDINLASRGVGQDRGRRLDRRTDESSDLSVPSPDPVQDVDDCRRFALQLCCAIGLRPNRSSSAVICRIDTILTTRLPKIKGVQLTRSIRATKIRRIACQFLFEGRNVTRIIP